MKDITIKTEEALNAADANDAPVASEIHSNYNHQDYDYPSFRDGFSASEIGWMCALVCIVAAFIKWG